MEPFIRFTVLKVQLGTPRTCTAAALSVCNPKNWWDWLMDFGLLGNQTGFNASGVRTMLL